MQECDLNHAAANAGVILRTGHVIVAKWEKHSCWFLGRVSPCQTTTHPAEPYRGLPSLSVPNQLVPVCYGTDVAESQGSVQLRLFSLLISFNSSISRWRSRCPAT